MGLPSASEKHRRVRLLVRDVETEVVHEHIRCVVYSLSFDTIPTLHRYHATVEVLFVTRIVIEIGMEERIGSRSSEHSIGLHVEVHRHILDSFLGGEPCGDVGHSLFMSERMESDVIRITDGLQLSTSHTLHQIILSFRHCFPSIPHSLTTVITIHHTHPLQNNDPNACD